MGENDERERIGNAATLPMSEETTDLPEGLPVLEVDGTSDVVERKRVQQALFGGTSRSFELGRYVIMSALGRGGMGVVFKAFDPTLDRLVALKVLHKELDEQHTTRLRREAKALAKLSHPNVVQVYEVGEVEGQTFVAMEMVKGKTLREWMKQDPRPDWREGVQVFIQVGEGLAAAHERGLVHRDFKPGNAIVDDEGRPRVLDFGLARQGDALEDEESTIQRARTDGHEGVPLDVSLTTTGAVLGTPAYMPPEQMSGEQADARSDQFSFCVALYEAVYGERPFAGSSMMALLVSMRTGEIRPVPKGSEVPTTLRTVLLRGLATAPEERWPSMEELLEQLRAVIAPRRGRWLALGGGIALGLGLVGAGLAYQADMGQRCTGAEAQLDGVWDDGRRQQVQAAILGTELSYAEGTWERVQPWLDDYAEAWAGTHTEVCEATAVRKEQSDEVLDLRMTCLGKRRTALRAAVDVLADADAKTVENAVELVAGLPGLDRCDDVPWLEEQNQRVPPPEDPDVAQQVDALRERLAVVEAMQTAGQYEPALTQAEEVLEQAEALAYEPLWSEAEYWRGNLLHCNGRYADAEQALEQAHARALRQGHDDVVLDAAQMLTFVVGNQLARYAEGLVWANTAFPLAEHADEDTELAQSLGNIGLVLDSQGKYEQAKLHHERALQIREKALGTDHLDVAESLNNLGVVFARQGEHEHAMLHFQRALQIRELALGTDHPEIAESLHNLTGLLVHQEEYEQAKPYCHRALQIKMKALGADHPHVAYSLTALGIVLGNLGEYEQAKPHYHRALRIQEKVLGDDHPDVALTLTNLGLVFERQGKYEQAKLHYHRALRIQEKALGDDHPEVAHSLRRTGDIFYSQGEYEQARLHYEHALQIREKARGSDHPDVAYPLVSLAKVALAQHDATAANEHAERAVSIYEAAQVPPEYLYLAEARFVLAQALWSKRTLRPSARALGEQARDVFAAVGKSQEANLAWVEAWLAKHPVQ